MTETTIALTDKIRTRHPGGYFSSFKEESVTIPNKPWIREILEDRLSPKLLSDEVLVECITTCIYFSLPSKQFTEELFWNISRKEKLFHSWFLRKGDIIDGSLYLGWLLKPTIPEPLRSELLASWGSYPDRTQLIRLGARWLGPSCEEISATGNLRLLRWVRKKWKSGRPRGGWKDPYKWDALCTTAAAANGHLKILQYLHRISCPWDIKTCSNAAGNGHLACLKYAHENGCPWNVRTCSFAAENGHLECLKYARGNGCPWNERTCKEAAKGGHLECLSYAHENGCPWVVATCANAAGGGHLECLQYAHENGCPWDQFICVNAAKGGHLACLKYAFENGCPLAPWTSDSAARGGNLACLQYTFEKGCRCGASTFSDAVEGGKVEVLKYLHELVASGTSSHLSEETSPSSSLLDGGRNSYWSKYTCMDAAERGHLEILKYLHQNGCPWDERTCREAATGETPAHLECLKYAHENGCPWDEKTSSNTAKEGNLRSLQYLHENGCPWDATTCSSAADKGHLKCLQYAHENGCPWDANTTIFAALRATERHVICRMSLLKEDGEMEIHDKCHWNESVCVYLGNEVSPLRLEMSEGICSNIRSREDFRSEDRRGHRECLKYARQHGCPTDMEVVNTCKDLAVDLE